MTASPAGVSERASFVLLASALTAIRFPPLAEAIVVGINWTADPMVRAEAPASAS